MLLSSLLTVTWVPCVVGTRGNVGPVCVREGSRTFMGPNLITSLFCLFFICSPHLPLLHLACCTLPLHAFSLSLFLHTHTRKEIYTHETRLFMFIFYHIISWISLFSPHLLLLDLACYIPPILCAWLRICNHLFVQYEGREGGDLHSRGPISWSLCVCVCVCKHIFLHMVGALSSWRLGLYPYVFLLQNVQFPSVNKIQFFFISLFQGSAFARPSWLFFCPATWCALWLAGCKDSLKFEELFFTDAIEVLVDLKVVIMFPLNLLFPNVAAVRGFFFFPVTRPSLIPTPFLTHVVGLSLTCFINWGDQPGHAYSASGRWYSTLDIFSWTFPCSCSWRQFWC